jgi:hypothetical protein
MAMSARKSSKQRVTSEDDLSASEQFIQVESRNAFVPPELTAVGNLAEMTLQFGESTAFDRAAREAPASGFVDQ